MADERYEWLGRDAAERLLRGEPVEVADERARTEAARLAAALDSAARNPGHGYDDGELPGEAAAMAAFRKARAESAAAGTSLGSVRVGRSRPSRGMGFARPVRFGIAAAFAGCAIGGVAVAAGSGVLPTFGDERPAPASSVSAAATPGPLTSPSSSGGDAGSSARPPGTTGTPPGLPPAPDSTTPSAPGDAGGSTPGLPAGDGAATPGGEDPSKNTDVYRKSVEACRDYRSGRIDPDRKRRLEAAAKGAERVERFCDELLGDGSGDAGTPGGENGGEGDGREDGDGIGGGKNSGGSGGDRDSDSSEGVPQLVPDTPQVSYPLVLDPAVTPSPTGSASLADATTRAL
ncbi:hypothetical protein [Streptomyces pristinaespiralis]|uniref:hypothetical protein n=1 Tax=Streptomyces pristinaespiralis TaxID=38300 RepID=UPI0033CB4FE8